MGDFLMAYKRKTPIPLIEGGTNASLTADNGGILYSSATAAAILASTSTANQPLLSGASGAPGWSTATYPGSTTANQILYSSANNTVAGLATANTAVLATNGSGVPSITATPTVTSITLGAGTALSNYLEGTFTAAVQFGGASTGITYSTQLGLYTRIGRMIYIKVLIVLSNKGSSVGAAQISGLPVSSNSTGSFNQLMPAVMSSVSFGAVTFDSFGVVTPSTTAVQLWGNLGSTGSAAQFTNANFGNGTVVYLEGGYFA